MRESEIEAYLVARVKDLGGEVRKVKWIGRSKAPDRFVMLPDRWRKEIVFGVVRDKRDRARSLWVEVKAEGGAATFPKNAHEEAQAREHERMRKMGQQVEVVDSIERVDEVLR